MTEIEFWKMILNQLVSEGLLTITESSDILKQLAKEVRV